MTAAPLNQIQYISEKSYLSKENPRIEIWDLFEQRLLTGQLPTKNAEAPDERALEEWNYLFRQAKNLHDLANVAPIETSPLQLYYSTLNLSKLYILIRSGRRLKNLANSHGLSFILDTQPKEFLDRVLVKINSKGTFSELLASTSRRTTIDSFSNRRISLTELLRHYVDIYDYLALEMKRSMHPVHSLSFRSEAANQAQTKRSSSLWIMLIGPKQISTLQQLQTEKPALQLSNFRYFPENNSVITKGPTGPMITESAESDSDLPIIQYSVAYDGQPFIFSPLTATHQGESVQLEFYQEEIQMMIAFLLSTLVRYYPDLWLELQEDRETYWLVRKTCNEILRSHHNYWLNRCAGENIIILPPGTLHRY